MEKLDVLERIRHSCAHVLAQAVLKFYPNARLGIGPAIENGFYYDFGKISLTEQDLFRIEKEMRDIVSKNLPFKKELWTQSRAKAYFQKQKQPFKLELIKDLKKSKVGMVSTGNVFLDLCRGGHVKNTSELPLDAFKLTKVAGAYWKGDEKREQLVRIYGVAFRTKEDLTKHLAMLEEAKKRDHRKLGQELDLFTFSELVGPGLPLWTPKGTVIREELEKFAKETEEKWGYKRIATPHIGKEELFKTSGHLPYYKDDMFPEMDIQDSEGVKTNRYYLKAMNCPITMAMFGQKPHSYREFPVRLAEYGTVYRYERAGVLSGLLRLRGFTQNDAHIFCREDQLEEEFVQVMKLHEYYYRDVFGLKDYYVRLSLRDKTKKDKFGGNDLIWKRAESIIRSAIKKSGVPFQEAVGEASFYGPKADFQIKSAVGREETASTNQIDFIMPARFGLKYTGPDGKEHPVAVIHRAPLGSHERFIGFLIEHYAGAFPVWLAPVQVVIIPVSEKFNTYGDSVREKLEGENIRVETSDANETLGKRIREGEMQKIPCLLVVGEKEQQNKTVSLRRRGNKEVKEMGIEMFLSGIAEEIKLRLS
ncbi:MAG TPA: threonine--tRNA ligase [Candidatus Paceibacterota bacterium]